MKTTNTALDSDAEDKGCKHSSAPTLKIYPDTVLRQRCEPVEQFNGELTDLVDRMFATLRKHHGLGLAAPQVGITKRLFIAEIEDHSLCIVNPSLELKSYYEYQIEGCLSLPGKLVDLSRNHQVEVTGYNLSGSKRHHQLKGMWARVAQHEIDHLNGVLIRDYVDPEVFDLPGCFRSQTLFPFKTIL